MNGVYSKSDYIFQMSLEEEKELTIYYNIYNTIYGKTLIASTDIGVCFVALGEEPFMIDELFNEYPKAKFEMENKSIHSKTITLIENPSAKIDILFHIKGTDFQMKVWGELLKIKPGSKCSYKNIAENLGNPKAVRAVGTAVGQNPISCIIPCHRVIRSDNSLGGYHWGLDIKEKLLEREFLDFNK